jgi:hypothetical protein
VLEIHGNFVAFTRFAVQEITQGWNSLLNDRRLGEGGTQTSVALILL